MTNTIRRYRLTVHSTVLTTRRFSRTRIWDKVFNNRSSKICGRQPLKNLKGYGLLKLYRFLNLSLLHLTYPLVHHDILVVWPLDFVSLCWQRASTTPEIPILRIPPLSILLSTFFRVRKYHSVSSSSCNFLFLRGKKARKELIFNSDWCSPTARLLKVFQHCYTTHST